MGKKKKKGGQKAPPQTNIKHVTCVECPKDINTIITQEECKLCEFHKDGYCKYVLPAQQIAVVAHGTPMKFNRAFFQSSSEEIANATRNYYMLTDIMHDVRAIPGYPNYSSMKRRFLSGEFQKPKAEINRSVVRGLDPVICLTKSDSGTPDILVEGVQYKITDIEKDTGGDWEVLYYLYDMYNLDGFADIQVQGKWYKVRLSPIKNSQVSYILARQGEKLTIGRLKQ